MNSMSIFAVEGLPLIQSGADLADLVVDRLTAMGEQLQQGDVVVFAQKVVSKAEGRLVRLADVTPDARARETAAIVGKDPRVIQVVLDDSNAVLRARRGLLVVEQRSGWVCANAGVDRSNVQADGDSEYLALLPADADASAAELRLRLDSIDRRHASGHHQRQPRSCLANWHGRCCDWLCRSPSDLESAWDA